MSDDILSTTSVTPEKGSVTWDSEGTEGGRFHSRKLHVPTDSSGLTLGRGYDMREKLAGTIASDLMNAGVAKADAEKIAKATGLKGADARQFIVDNELADFEVSQVTQKKLFEITYKWEAGEAKRLSTKDDVTAKYGTTNWDKLHPAIQDMLVDLKFRGDYTGLAREKIQKYVASNDLESFAKTMCDVENWKNVPKDRFERRKKLMDDAIKAKATEDKLAPKIPWNRLRLTAACDG